MKRLGRALFFFGAGSIVLYFIDMQFILLAWIDLFPPAAAWAIRIGLAVVGGVLWLIGKPEIAVATPMPTPTPAPAPAPATELRRWTHRPTGSFTDARLVSSDAEHVLLERTDGQRARIRREELAAADQSYLAQFGPG